MHHAPDIDEPGGVVRAELLDRGDDGDGGWRERHGLLARGDDGEGSSGAAVSRLAPRSRRKEFLGAEQRFDDEAALGDWRRWTRWKLEKLQSSSTEIDRHGTGNEMGFPRKRIAPQHLRHGPQ